MMALSRQARPALLHCCCLAAVLRTLPHVLLMMIAGRYLGPLYLPRAFGSIKAPRLAGMASAAPRGVGAVQADRFEFTASEFTASNSGLFTYVQQHNPAAAAFRGDSR
jgi:hypothetical protein